MKRRYQRHYLTGVALGALWLSGCASVNLDQLSEPAQAAALQAFDLPSSAALSLSKNEHEQQQKREQISALLKEPLGQKQALQLALINHPTIQAQLAKAWRDASQSAQTGQLFNPTFSFERTRYLNELELGRAISFNLFDLLTLPRRQRVAKLGLENAQADLIRDVLTQLASVRATWVNALAAQEKLDYAKQVLDLAQSSAELAKRMKAAGNFNQLKHDQQQLFLIEAQTQLKLAQLQANQNTELLIRSLGLSPEQATQLQIPKRLPDLPTELRTINDINQIINEQRLDIRQAKLELIRASGSQTDDGLLGLPLRDLELKLRRDTVFENGDHGAEKNHRYGYEIEFELPIFNWGSARNNAVRAEQLRAQFQLEHVMRQAASQLRQSYMDYNVRFDIAKSYQDALAPLKKSMLDENLLAYNGMLIDVFALLQEGRSQVQAVIATIDAKREFWLADANLQNALIGLPMSDVSISETKFESGEAGSAKH